MAHTPLTDTQIVQILDDPDFFLGDDDSFYESDSDSDCTVAVSYTHLDVYKRQVYYMLLGI